MDVSIVDALNDLLTTLKIIVALLDLLYPIHKREKNTNGVFGFTAKTPFPRPDATFDVI